MAAGNGQKNTNAGPEVYEWLLEPGDFSIRYRTMTELLDENPQDAEVIHVREQISASQLATNILSKMHPDGYWLQKNPRTSEFVGEGTEYGAYATTHFCLAYLAELGLDRQHPQISKAAERYLNLQKEDGDFFRHLSCLYGYNIRTFILLGYRQDSRVQKSIDLMLATKRADGGYLCDLHESKYKTKAAKSCIRGSAKALLAFAELQEYWEHPRCLALIEYFLKREVLFRTSDPEMTVNHDVTRTHFPITWRAGLIEMLYALSKMGYGANEELNRAWELLESKRDAEGKFRLDWAPTQALLKPGKRGEPNKWVTLYALLAKKYKVEKTASPLV